MSQETIAQRQVRLIVEAKCRELAVMLSGKLPKGQGFALFLFDFGAEGNVAYVSTATRDTMREAIKEWLEKTRTEENSQ
jgi:hypothetical protein